MRHGNEAMKRRGRVRGLRTLKRLCRRLGVDLVRYPPPESFGRHLTEILALLQVNLILDVGAHFGEFGELLRDVGYAGVIVSFEPIDENYRELMKRTKHDRRWYAYKLALGDQDGTATINVMQATVFSSFLQPNEYSEARFGSQNTAARQELVQVARLDSIYRRVVAGIDCPRPFLKLDTQGWDTTVIAGAAGVLDEMVGLQTEVSVKPIYDGMPSYLDVLPRMQAAGFDIVGLYPVSWEAGTHAAIEFDCLLARAQPEDRSWPVPVARATDLPT
jgi:FkbM family methyltransferase